MLGNATVENVYQCNAVTDFMDNLNQRSKRIFVSVPRDHNLERPQRALKHAILAELRSKGLDPQEFQVSGLPLRSPYTFQAVREIMGRCHGALILAFARWHDQSVAAGLAI